MQWGPNRLLSRGTNFFRDRLDKDDQVLKKLGICPAEPVLHECMKDMLAV